MAEICHSLGFERIRTSVYHPQTDGLVERYNKTIKTVLRKVISEAGKDWEKKLPLVLYAIRTHVQASTGHSSFELLFGQQPRTVLEMLAEQWEESEEEVKDILTYTKELRDSLHTGQRQTVCAPRNKEKEETPVERRVRAEEAGVTRKEDGRLLQQPVKSQKVSGGWKRMESAPEVSTVPTAAQEAHLEVSSHASGEARLTQVRP
ncbi:hypothetical protein NDU88_004993 [Pleurodeles waltl]|uniref:Integrase catalytic domain-containing protein n=1 Tax=Pleurodeles waltl TaxID=8319 RepID=A0AAV7SKD6_PLEWA|nr:hypothetical protein NDU88_004993 [Pleurodeles waltl]